MHKKLVFITLLLLLISCFSGRGDSWHMGSDSNKNGVRDDVEKWIDDTFSEKGSLHKAMMKLASIDPADCSYKHHLNCLEQVSDNALILQIQLFEKTLNTDKRRAAFEKRVSKCVKTDERTTKIKCSL